jgi:hypothetical protein
MKKNSLITKIKELVFTAEELNASKTKTEKVEVKNEKQEEKEIKMTDLKTQDGLIIRIDSDNNAFLMNEEGELIAIENGTYILEDESELIIENGKVVEKVEEEMEEKEEEKVDAEKEKEEVEVETEEEVIAEDKTAILEEKIGVLEITVNKLIEEIEALKGSQQEEMSKIKEKVEVIASAPVSKSEETFKKIDGIQEVMGVKHKKLSPEKENLKSIIQKIRK